MNDFHWDFATLLTVATVLTGIVWLLDRLFWRPQRLRLAPAGVEAKPNALVDFCCSFFPVIALVLLLRSFVAEPFRIPSGSMIPTLSVGDFILVNKYAYGLRDPVFHHEFIRGARPQRGDVVVFRWPVDPSKDFIKRIVGLPGDRIAYRDKQLFVNGGMIALEPAGVFSGTGGAVYRFSENLTGREHHIIINPDRPARDFEFTVPAGEYFAMGDNRDGSDDSRRWGTVPERNLVGRAFFIWMSWDSNETRVDFSRIGTVIQ